jgi:hypothetical protein
MIGTLMEKHICQAHIWDRYSQYTCGKTAKAESNGKWFCGIHSPEAAARRKAKSDARSAEWNRQWNEKDRHAKLISFKLECFDEMLEELRAIGHQTTITTEHYNRLQRLIVRIESHPTRESNTMEGQ